MAWDLPNANMPMQCACVCVWGGGGEGVCNRGILHAVFKYTHNQKNNVTECLVLVSRVILISAYSDTTALVSRLSATHLYLPLCS